jgi:hypothetical protein
MIRKAAGLVNRARPDILAELAGTTKVFVSPKQRDAVIALAKAASDFLEAAREAKGAGIVY